MKPIFDSVTFYVIVILSWILVFNCLFIFELIEGIFEIKLDNFYVSSITLIISFHFLYYNKKNVHKILYGFSRDYNKSFIYKTVSYMYLIFSLYTTLYYTII